MRIVKTRIIACERKYIESITESNCLDNKVEMYRSGKD